MGCSSVSLNQAPIVDQSKGAKGLKGLSANPADVDNTPAPAGYYRVKSGDTLRRIALDHGQNYRDVAQWNTLANPDRIEVGQLLRIVPPQNTKPASLTPPATTALNQKNKTALSDKTNSLETQSNASPAPSSAMSQVTTTGELQWPKKGKVIDAFNETTKGINIEGALGDPIYAAAAGKVVYAGNGLRGYGNLIIIKHDNNLLTAYAYNQTLLVKEGETIQQGQKIATMGQSLTGTQALLHFEVRSHGKPVDPMKYLSQQ